MDERDLVMAGRRDADPRDDRCCESACPTRGSCSWVPVPAGAPAPPRTRGRRRSRTSSACWATASCSTRSGSTYAERTDWLLDAACAVSCHPRHLETRFAFRTRYLDCLWARLPLVVTEGDVLADRIAAENLGATVPERDPAALADALERVLTHGRTLYGERLAAAAADYAWPRALADLVAFATATGERPVPLGDGVPRRPGHAARDRGYRTVKGALNAAGVRDWPRGLTAL